MVNMNSENFGNESNVLVFCRNVLIITPMDEGTLIHHHFLAACLVTKLSLNLVTKHAVGQPIKINKLSAASLETTQSPLMDDIR